MPLSQCNSNSKLEPRMIVSGFAATLLLYLFYMQGIFSRGRIIREVGILHVVRGYFQRKNFLQKMNCLQGQFSERKIVSSIVLNHFFFVYYLVMHHVFLVKIVG
jgi:hypothetical protein